MANQEAAGRRRETRLLLATIAVSVGMLLMLARFRFPEEAARQTVDPAPAPLERLAARATFDELASIMADLERRILPAITTIAGQGIDDITYVPAVRMTPDRAVALLPGDLRLAATGATPAPAIVLRDAVRELVVVQAPPRADTAPAVPYATIGRPGPRYVAIAEATSGAPVVRPVYVGRTDRFTDPRWADPLLTVAAVQQTISPGAAVFSLDGAFIGLASVARGRLTIVQASTLRDVAASAQPDALARSALPFDVQPLTAELARAAGAAQGVMISYVRDASLAASPGDVVQSIDGTSVTSVGGYQMLAQSRKPGAQVKLEIIRRGQPLVVTVTATEADAEPAGSASVFGAVLREVFGAGAEVVTVDPGTAAHRAGLRQGDVIIALDGVVQPDDDAVLRLFRTAKPGDSLLMTLRRDGDHRVVAVEKQ